MRATPGVVDRDREIMVAKTRGIANGVDGRAAREGIHSAVFPSELEYHQLSWRSSRGTRALRKIVNW